MFLLISSPNLAEFHDTALLTLFRLYRAPIIPTVVRDECDVADESHIAPTCWP